MRTSIPEALRVGCGLRESTIAVCLRGEAASRAAMICLDMLPLPASYTKLAMELGWLGRY